MSPERQKLPEIQKKCYKMGLSLITGVVAMNSRPSPLIIRKPRLTDQDREARRRRIFALLQEGWSYEAIADEVALSTERVRQIVAESLARRAAAPKVGNLHLQIARLEPALRLAAARVAAGELRAVDRLLRVLERLEKLEGVAATALKDEEDDSAKFDAKLDDLARRYREQQARRKEADAATTED
jgi:hypothetical protein